MSGRLDAGDRLVQALLLLVSLICIANGAFMVSDPFGWYFSIDTVRFTGPPNQHFIRDIGLAYLTCGAFLGYAAAEPRMRWLSATAGTVWITLHGLFHVWEPWVGLCTQDTFWRASPGTLGPPALAWLALAILFARQRVSPAGMPDRLVLSAMDRLTDGDAGYAREMARAPGRPFERFKHFMPLSAHRHAAPRDLVAAARLGAAMIEDCGPCVMITARAALADGVAPELVNAMLQGDLPEGDLRLGLTFGRAIAELAPSASTLVDEIEARFGRTTRLELSLAAATARVYPAIKRGLGLTRSCAITALQV